ncbi:hypothetical protein [Haloarchaeobius sp. DFWS5]|uniref:hypothetical protein n=1 Tax=Haloarchaeobius sp. DFWS5 TaxID=3446114 RepID=UPI003EB74403
MLARDSTVLVVAADELTRRRCGDWLVDGDYSVVETGVFDEALATAKHAAVALVAGNVPGTTHEGLVETLRRHGGDCAVVSIGSGGGPGLACDAELDSPVRRGDLVDTVDRLVSRATYVDRLDALLATARRAAVVDPERAERLHSETRDMQRDFDTDDFEAVFRAIDPS